MADRLSVTLHEVLDAMDTYADVVLRREFGLSFNSYEYLSVLQDLDAPDVTTLAACLRLTKAAVSKRLPTLEAAGWVVRRSDPHHARRVLLALTPHGADLAARAGARLDAELAEVLGVRAGDGAALDPARLHADLLVLLTRLRTMEAPR